MTPTLASLIERVRAEKNAFSDEWSRAFKNGGRYMDDADAKLNRAIYDLAKYVVAHAADYAERERLERALVTTVQVFRGEIRVAGDADDDDVIDATVQLVDWLVRHAETETT